MEDRDHFLEAECYRVAIATIIEGVIAINSEGRIELFNPAAERIFGYSAGEVLGQNINLLMPEPHDTYIRNFLRTGVPEVIGLGREVEGRKKDGAVFPLFLALSEMHLGGQCKFVAVVQDLSDIKKIEGELRESEQRFRMIADSAPVMIWMSGRDGGREYFNQTWLDFTGRPLEQELGQGWSEAIHPDDLAGYLAIYREALVRRQPFKMEYRLRRADGEYRWIWSNGVPHRNEVGDFIGLIGVCWDITERHNLETALRESTIFQRAIFNSANYAIISASPDGIITSFNQTAEQWLGYRAEEVVGRFSVEQLHEPGEITRRAQELSQELGMEVPPGFKAFLAKVRRGLMDEREWTYVRKDGSRFPVRLSLTALQDDDNRFTGILGVAIDITLQKQAEEQVRKLSVAVEQSPASVSITDLKGNLEYVNPKFTPTTGYTAAELLGKNIFIWKFGEKSAAKYREMWQTITSGQEWQEESHSRTKNGELFWESISVSPIKDASGAITHFLAVMQDITTMKAAQEEVAKLSLVASKTDNAVVITDKNGCIEWVNEGFTRLTGYRLEEVKGQKPGKILQGPQTDGDTVARIREYLRREQSFTEEILEYHKNGQPLWVSMDVTPIFNDQGEITRFISITRNITHQKEAEEALQWAKEAAETANRAKSEFLARMSHEIRTPMNAIIGMAELLWETPLDQEQRHYVEIFRSAGETLLNLINDILDLSKVEAGEIVLENVDFDLAELVEKVCEVMALGAHQKGIELACRVLPEVPSRLVGDPVRLRQVLTNLMGNAIKFTETGEVVVEVKLDEQDPAPPPEACRLRIMIRDTGIGIPPEQIDMVFDDFTQADASTTRKYGGTGLGLAIAKRLVELMGGNISVESLPGTGSTFSFTAQFAVQQEWQEKPQPPAVLMQGLKVLVVDDHATNRLILREILTGWGAAVTEAADGEEALALMKQAKEEGAPFQLALVDYRMPRMDGFQLAGRIKDEAGLTGMAVMMLTSDARSGDAARARQLGLGGYMVKPIKRLELQAAINEAMTRTRTISETTEAAPSAEPGGGDPACTSSWWTTPPTIACWSRPI